MEKSDAYRRIQVGLLDVEFDFVDLPAKLDNDGKGSLCAAELRAQVFNHADDFILVDKVLPPDVVSQ